MPRITSTAALGHGQEPAGRIPWARRRLLLALAAVPAAGCAYIGERAAPPEDREREHDPRAMTRTEVQMLQDALIWTGGYESLKDGKWGPLTAEAARTWRRGSNLRASETFTDGELALLFRAAIRARGEVGWTTWRDPYTGGWLGYPAALVRPGAQKAPSEGLWMTEFESLNPALALTAMRASFDVAGVRKVISALQPAADKVTYRLDRATRQVVSFDLGDGRVNYLRLDRVEGGWRGFAVVGRQDLPGMRSIMSAVSAEFSATGAPVIDRPEDMPVLGPIVARLGASPDADRS